MGVGSGAVSISEHLRRPRKRRCFSVAGRPGARSGALAASVRTSAVVAVAATSPTCAEPKSPRRAPPTASKRTLVGLTARCKTPISCAAASAGQDGARDLDGPRMRRERTEPAKHSLEVSARHPRLDRRRPPRLVLADGDHRGDVARTARRGRRRRTAPRPPRRRARRRAWRTASRPPARRGWGRGTRGPARGETMRPRAELRIARRGTDGARGREGWRRVGGMRPPRRAPRPRRPSSPARRTRRPVRGRRRLAHAHGPVLAAGSELTTPTSPADPGARREPRRGRKWLGSRVQRRLENTGRLSRLARLKKGRAGSPCLSGALPRTGRVARSTALLENPCRPRVASCARQAPPPRTRSLARRIHAPPGRAPAPHRHRLRRTPRAGARGARRRREGPRSPPWTTRKPARRCGSRWRSRPARWRAARPRAGAALARARPRPGPSPQRRALRPSLLERHAARPAEGLQSSSSSSWAAATEPARSLVSSASSTFVAMPKGSTGVSPRARAAASFLAARSARMPSSRFRMWGPL